MQLKLLSVEKLRLDFCTLMKIISERLPLFSSIEFIGDVNVPSEAYVARRGQYDAETILNFLFRLSKPGQKVLGLTSLDLCIKESNLNFVFGLAQCPGRAAVVSIFRLDPKFYGEEENACLLFERVTKECLHELGHTFGLGHCKSPFCVMRFSNSIMEVDRKGEILCVDCKRLLKKYLSAGEGI